MVTNEDYAKNCFVSLVQYGSEYCLVSYKFDTCYNFFCFTLIELKLIYIFFALSIIHVFIKNYNVDKLRIGKTTRIYKHLGIHKIKLVTHNGDIVNKLLKSKFPEHKIIRTEKKSISTIIFQTYTFEKFHLVYLFFSAYF